ncbi:hypothetical protein K438DRAFT_1750578 [Mycena galopus ATCC 62051]|nr:hypothetical protein K438DRAFT_1750578 [Mycena galopus ATCC 62051]
MAVPPRRKHVWKRKAKQDRRNNKIPRLEPELPLLAYDVFAPPVVEELTEEERVERHARREELNNRIRRWLKYRAQSLRRKTTKAALSDSPYAALLSKLSGIKTPPKARQAYQQFMHEKVTEIAGIVDIRWKEKSINTDGSANTGKPKAPFRSAVAREMFKELPSSEQEAYAACAMQEAREAKEAYAKALEAGPSKSPEARQRCINNFGKFIAPIMKGIFDYTGLQGHIVLGGPMPRYNGELLYLCQEGEKGRRGDRFRMGYDWARNCQRSMEVNGRGFRNTDMDHYTTARFKGMKEEGKGDGRGLPEVKASKPEEKCRRLERNPVSRRIYAEGRAMSGNPEVMRKSEMESNKYGSSRMYKSGCPG